MSPLTKRSAIPWKGHPSGRADRAPGECQAGEESAWRRILPDPCCLVSVGEGSAVDEVPADEGVVAALGHEPVGPGAADEQVAAIAPVQHVITVAAKQDVVATAPLEAVVAVFPVEPGRQEDAVAHLDVVIAAGPVGDES